MQSCSKCHGPVTLVLSFGVGHYLVHNEGGPAIPPIWSGKWPYGPQEWVLFLCVVNCLVVITHNLGLPAIQYTGACVVSVHRYLYTCRFSVTCVHVGNMWIVPMLKSGFEWPCVSCCVMCQRIAHMQTWNTIRNPNW